MIENGFVYAVEKAVERDEKRERENKPKSFKLREELLKRHKNEIEKKGLANVDCGNWNKKEQKMILKYFKIDGYKEKTIIRSWNLNKL